MDWIGQWLGVTVGTEASLQSSGTISKETLMAFFAKGRAMFASKDFNSILRQGFESGRNCEEMINQAQSQARCCMVHAASRRSHVPPHNGIRPGFVDLK